MNIFSAYKRTKVFLIVNILGLATGLAAAIMLILFVVNEYSYDRHFENSERIVSLNTVVENEDVTYHNPINLRMAYTQLPSRVPGIEAAVQIKKGTSEVQYGDERFRNMRMYYADPDFFKVFKMKLVEGSEKALNDLTSLVITRPKAEAIFGSAWDAIGKILTISDVAYTVSAVVEPLPLNTHFTFDILAHIETLPLLNIMSGIEFYTFYLIEKGQSTDDVRRAIEKEYTTILEPWIKGSSGIAYGETDRLTDLYLKAKADWTLGERNSMRFVWMLSALAFFILAFAITNFINLFTAQGETRMREIGVRKTYGAQPDDLVRQLFSEVGVLVAIAFALGLLLATQLTPAFEALIHRPIDIRQFYNPVFIACIAGLFAITVVLSASYTSFYLSRLNPMDILAKRLRFSKGRLTVAIVGFQSVVTIVLLSFVMIVNRQADYLKDIPVGYNPKNVMIVNANSILSENYDALRQELLALPVVEAVAGSQHIIGASGGYSANGIEMLNSTEEQKSINSYRIFPGLGELMQLELVEGDFFKENAPGNKWVVLNEAAVDMLGLKYPVTGQQVDYNGQTTVIGVVRDFIYDDPGSRIQPLAFSEPIPFYGARNIFIRLNDGTDLRQAQGAIQAVLRKFDSGYVLSPIWSEDIYKDKFAGIETQGKIIFTGSLLAIILAMSGLLAIHLYSALRRTKEIAIRRINGAERSEIFMLLSRDMLGWILAAGIVAVPIAWYLATRWFSTTTNHISLNPAMFIVPIVIQMVIALLVTSGVSIRVSSQNPVKSLKAE